MKPGNHTGSLFPIQLHVPLCSVLKELSISCPLLSVTLLQWLRQFLSLSYQTSLSKNFLSSNKPWGSELYFKQLRLYFFLSTNCSSPSFLILLVKWYQINMYLNTLFLITIVIIIQLTVLRHWLTFLNKKNSLDPNVTWYKKVDSVIA